MDTPRIDGADPKASMEDVKDDLRQLKNDFAELIAGLAETGKARAQDKAEQTRAAAEDYHGQLADMVYERPLSSLAIAFGVGVIFAKMFGSNS